MESLTIRLCEPGDAHQLALLIGALAREEGTAPATQDGIAATVTALIENETSNFVLATLDDEPVGCVQIAWRVSTWQAAPYAYLEDVYVVPAHRGRGVGRRMLTTAMQHIAERGAVQIMLDVRMENPDARRLYEHLGFKHADSILMKRVSLAPDD
jgi:ribosomal protein S18 acetylase RimI-like enzyme